MDDRKMTCERIHFMAPYCNVTVAARIKGYIEPEPVEKALDKILELHPVLTSAISMNREGAACYVPGAVREFQLDWDTRNNDNDWIVKIHEEERKPFCLFTGPLIRFSLLSGPQCSDLIVISHHILCDGMSLIYLIRDILVFMAASSMPVEPLPIPPVIENMQPPDSSLPFPGSLLINRLNSSWRKSRSRKVFTETDYLRIFHNYWNNEAPELQIHTLDEEITSALIARCRKEKVTVNSAVLTALSAAQMNIRHIRDSYYNELGMAVNIRVEDSVFYSLYDNFFNKVSAFTAYILKLKGKRRGLGITNLGRTDIPLEYGLYKLETVFFIPPYWPNNEKVLSIVTSGGSMNVSIQYQPSVIEPSIVSTVWIAARKYLEEAIG